LRLSLSAPPGPVWIGGNARGSAHPPIPDCPVALRDALAVAAPVGDGGFGLLHGSICVMLRQSPAPLCRTRRIVAPGRLHSAVTAIRVAQTIAHVCAGCPGADRVELVIVVDALRPVPRYCADYELRPVVAHS
jgi:hypothetical protein